MEEVNHDRIQAASLFFNSLLVLPLMPSNACLRVTTRMELCFEHLICE